jgi:hypothetical protein
VYVAVWTAVVGTALTRDMQAVQKLVLSSPDWDVFMLDPPYDIRTVVASAFARYPYPESFFAARGAQTAAGMIFFIRSNRPPAWAPVDAGANRFPVAVRNVPAVAGPIVARMGADAAHRRRFSIFQLQVDGVPHQVIVRLLYHDQFRDRLDGILGFMVDMPWVRRYYFPELTAQMARIGGMGLGPALAVVDAHGDSVARTTSSADAGPTSRRAFPMMFFDPLLVVLDPPAEQPWEQWAVEVSAVADPTLAAAIRGADRTLIVAALAAASLAFGFVLTARAVRASSRLAEMRSDFVATVTHELKTPIATIRAAGDTLVSGRISATWDQREYAQLVVQEAKRLTRLVDNLLAMARITDVAVFLQPLALGHWRTPYWKSSPTSSQRRIRHTGRHSAGPSAVRADRTAMSLLFNLVDNAIRYSPATDRCGFRRTAMAPEWWCWRSATKAAAFPPARSIT